MHTPQAPCQALATPAGDGCYALRFELGPPGAAALDLAGFEPFTSFDLSASAGGQALPVHQPALDIAVRPCTWHLAPGTVLTLHTPIRLCFNPDGPASQDGFTWTIARARPGVSVVVRPGLPAPFDQPCALRFD